jgi:beta-phosphoglucomutase
LTNLYRKQIKAVIFDLDGVIVSTDNLHYKGWKKLAEEEQIYFDEIINNRLRGVSRMESLEILLENSKKEYSTEEKAALAERKNSYYVELLASLTPDNILPGVNEVLKELKCKDIQVAIGSSSKNTANILKKIALFEAFDAIADGNDIKHSKPNPEVFLVASKKLGIPPEYCVVVEDAVAGIQAAINADMTSVAVGDAKGYELADYSIDSINQLLDIVI